MPAITIHNALLSSLPDAERAYVESQCEPVVVSHGERLGTPGEPIHHVHFPAGALLAPVIERDRHSLAVALIGSEGAWGSSLLLGAHGSPVSVLVQGSGRALRMDAGHFMQSLQQAPLLENELRLHLNALLVQFAQTAYCATFHLISRRLASWLLHTHDRVPGDRFYLTHDLLATLLGVRRTGITEAAGVLQRRKCITYTRGRVVVLDRLGLEREACQCYRLSRESYRPLVQLASANAEDAGQPALRHMQRVAAGASPRRRSLRNPLRPDAASG